MNKLELTKNAINNLGYVDIDRKNLETIEAEIRADERKKFAEWCKMKGYSCYDWRMLIEQYEKEQE